MENFNLEKMWKDYLVLVELDPEKMSVIQYRETKRAFMAGCGSLYIMISTEVSKLSEDKAMEALENLDMQIMNFWDLQMGNVNNPQDN